MGGEIIVTDVDIMKEKMADEAEARIRELEAQLAEARKNK